jgi:hypothetical protein
MELKPSYFIEKEFVFCLIIAEIDNPMNLGYICPVCGSYMTANRDLYPMKLAGGFR